MSTPEQVFARLNQMPGAIERGHRVALKAAGEKARSVMAATPGALSRVGKHPIRPTVKVVDENTVSVKWGPAGWVRIVNDRTQPHFIARRGGGSLRRQNLTSGLGRKSTRAGRLLLGALSGGPIGGVAKGPINIPGIGPRMYAKHPGTKGKHFVEKGKALAVPLAAQTFATKAVTEPMRSIFHG